MAGNDSGLTRRQISFDDMEIGAAHTTGADAQQNVSRRDARIGNFGNLQRPLGNRSR